MGSPKLHVLFFPIFASGHMLPMVDVARLFSERGVKATFVITPDSLPAVRHAVDGSARSGHPIHLLLLPFPDDASESAIYFEPDSGIAKFHHSLELLRHPLRRLLHDHRPDCIISDYTYTWTSDLASELGIPRIIFQGPSAFAVSIYDAFVVSGGDLPHRIELSRLELSPMIQYSSFLDIFREAERKSYGSVLVTFYEMEPAYVEDYKNLAGRSRRVWCVGPTHLCNRSHADKAARGGGSSDDHGVEEWLDAKDPGSVLYVCFGSGCVFTADQLREIAAGLEASGRPFIWVVRGSGGGAETLSEWMPVGFEERTAGRGLVITGWAPQLVILYHPAVGCFITHAGWGSVMEAVGAGVPMVAWPLDWDQFLNERLIVDVAGVGVRILEGAARAAAVVQRKEVVGGEAVRKAVERVMGGGDEARALRERAEQYGSMARSAMEVGGSSYVNLTCLIQELTLMAEERMKNKSRELELRIEE